MHITQTITLVVTSAALFLTSSAAAKETIPSFDDLVGLAAANDPSALYALGSFYSLGEEHVVKDVDLAMLLFEMSSKAGSKKATQKLVIQVANLDRQYQQIQERLSYDREHENEILVDLCFTKSQRDHLDDFLYTSTGWVSEKRGAWKEAFEEYQLLLADVPDKDQFFARSRAFAQRTIALANDFGEYTFSVRGARIDYEQAYYRTYFRAKEALGITNEDDRDNRKRGWLDFSIKSKADARIVTSRAGYDAAVKRIKERGEVTEKLFGPLANSEVFEEAEWLAYAKEISEKRDRFEVRNQSRLLSEEKRERELIQKSCDIRRMKVEGRVASKFLELFDRRKRE